MAVLQDLQSAVAGWSAALAADAASPQPSYTLNGKTVSQAEWRTALLENIKNANMTINQYQPYVTRTRHSL